jgi:hypothetical protein
MKALVNIVLIYCFYFSAAFGQHDSHMFMSNSDHNNADSTEKMQMPSMFQAFSLHLPVNMDGSGTGWLPDNSPMLGYMIHKGGWNFMIHENIFFRYDNQDITRKGQRGAHLWDVPNWFMINGQKRTGPNGLFRFSAMISFDYLTIGNAGYPLLMHHFRITGTTERILLSEL